jgi:hypothetical protein
MGVPVTNERIKAEQTMMADLRRALFAVVEFHETQGCGHVDPGQVCWGGRINMLAFLCHSLSLRGERVSRELVAAIGEYDLKCSDPSCKHEIQ